MSVRIFRGFLLGGSTIATALGFAGRGATQLVTAPKEKVSPKPKPVQVRAPRARFEGPSSIVGTEGKSK